MQCSGLGRGGRSGPSFLDQRSHEGQVWQQRVQDASIRHEDVEVSVAANPSAIVQKQVA